jgi:glycosyltransferase involved in cell wall biosynthesis
MHPLAHTAPKWASYPVSATLPPPIIRDPALPLVSIVTPSFNQGMYIGDTIASVLGQDYPNIEYWIIDAGSSDQTMAAIAPFRGDPRLHVLVEPDRGQADAINKGWARARGTILAWLNSDDTYLPGALRTQVQVLMAHPQAGGVYGDAQYTAADGRPLHRLRARPYTPLAVLRLEIPAQPSMFLRRELVAQVGRLNVARRYSMDTDYWARAAQHWTFMHANHLIATYRLHAASKTVDAFSGFYPEWLAISEQFFADPACDPALRPARAGVLADIYAAMANLEARRGRLALALRYSHFAVMLGGLRPRMVKLPVALLDRLSGRDLSALATAVWGWWRRGW